MIMRLGLKRQIAVAVEYVDDALSDPSGSLGRLSLNFPPLLLVSRHILLFPPKSLSLHERCIYDDGFAFFMTIAECLNCPA
jgi:hypothetical protein